MMNTLKNGFLGLCFFTLIGCEWPVAEVDATSELNRHRKDFYFTKHAICRIDCRQITQMEVAEIYKKGIVNKEKSNVNDRRGPTYALEGFSNDGQHIRLIVAPSKKQLTIVTVIDLEKEWQCHCY